MGQSIGAMDNGDRTDKEKPKLLYVGHSYHQLTSSTKFLIELLERHFQVQIVWDEGWRPGGEPLTAERINEHRPELLLFFQTLPPLKQFRRVKCKRMFLVPMHDHVMGNPQGIWRKVRDSGIRLINFCRATHEYFCNLGYESILVQYWQAPVVRKPLDVAGVRVFFWIRMSEIDWSLLKKLLGSLRPEQVIFRVAEDPGQKIAMPSPEDIGSYNIRIVTGWLEKAEYVGLLQSCNVFVAPRRFEGIGQSFLEAMAHGLAVIASNTPTMNEYVRDNQNGYLYDLAEPRPFDPANLTRLREQALRDVRDGSARWQAQAETLIRFVQSSGPRRATLRWRILGALKR